MTGNVADFDAAAYRQSVATMLNKHISLVQVTATPARRRLVRALQTTSFSVETTVVAQSALDASAMQIFIASSISTGALATTLLATQTGVTATFSAPVIVTTIVYPPPPAPPPSSPSPPQTLQPSATSPSPPAPQPVPPTTPPAPSLSGGGPQELGSSPNGDGSAADATPLIVGLVVGLSVLVLLLLLAAASMRARFRRALAKPPAPQVVAAGVGLVSVSSGEADPASVAVDVAMDVATTKEAPPLGEILEESSMRFSGTISGTRERATSEKTMERARSARAARAARASGGGDQGKRRSFISTMARRLSELGMDV